MYSTETQLKMSYMLYAVLLFYFFNGNNAKLLATLESDATYSTLRDIMERVYAEETFETIFILEAAAKSCFPTKELVRDRRKIPLIITTVNASVDKLKDRFNSKLLAIVCLSDEQQQPDFLLLNALAANLQHLRQTRIILYLPASKPEQSELLATLSIYFEEHFMTKVIGFTSNTVTHFCRYHPFPDSHWRLELLNTTQNYFLSHENNLQGKSFITLPSQILPRCVVIVDSTGVQHLSGYVGYLMSAFVEKHNITMRFLYTVKSGELIHLTTLLEYVTNGTIDFAVTLVPLYIDITKIYPLMTYPVEIIAWFVMLPCPQPLEYAGIYMIVVTVHVIAVIMVLLLLFSLVDNTIKYLFYKRCVDFDFVGILVNENIFRGIFGLSIPLRSHPTVSLKILYIFLFLLGLFVSNMYSAYFQTLFTSPPLEDEILTFDDLRRTQLKLMVDRNEIRLIAETFGVHFNKTFSNSLQLEATETFQRHRREFDSTYGYTVPEPLWSVFKAQQETYDTEIFCLASNLQLFNALALSIPLAENSYLTAPLSMLVLRVIETGLLAHWSKQTFRDLMKSKELYFNRPAEKEFFHDITVEDVKFPFYMWLCGLFVSSVLFLLEIYVFKLRKRCKEREKEGERERMKRVYKITYVA